jgi:hypothetical protein
MFYGDCVKMCEDFAPNFGDNAPFHTFFFQEKIFDQHYCCPHPPYSPNLAPCDFTLFPQLKMKLKGCCFDTIEVIEAELQAVLNTLTEHDFQDAPHRTRLPGCI